MMLPYRITLIRTFWSHWNRYSSYFDLMILIFLSYFTRCLKILTFAYYISFLHRVIIAQKNLCTKTQQDNTATWWTDHSSLHHVLFLLLGLTLMAIGVRGEKWIKSLGVRSTLMEATRQHRHRRWSRHNLLPPNFSKATPIPPNEAESSSSRLSNPQDALFLPDCADAVRFVVFLWSSENMPSATKRSKGSIDACRVAWSIYMYERSSWSREYRSKFSLCNRYNLFWN